MLTTRACGGIAFHRKIREIQRKQREWENEQFNIVNSWENSTWIKEMIPDSSSLEEIIPGVGAAGVLDLQTPRTSSSFRPRGRSSSGSRQHQRDCQMMSGDPPGGIAGTSHDVPGTQDPLIGSHITASQNTDGRNAPRSRRCSNRQSV